MAGRMRIRALVPSLYLGDFNPGNLNSITDVPGVLAHTLEIIEPRTKEHHEINTGVTAILPRRDVFSSGVYAGIFRFNGAGEMTGSHWLEETGVLNCPIIITGTLSVGAAHEGQIIYFVRETRDKDGIAPEFVLPVVAETWDGGLSDAGALAVRPHHVVTTIDGASADALPEGNKGGGTAMICHGVKGGTGSASRIVPVPFASSNSRIFTLGVAVQANYGALHTLRVGGVPVGKIILRRRDEAALPPHEEKKKDGSIIIVIATDAPLMPLQLQRLAKRATVGLSRVGGLGKNSSGDIFIAFSTATDVPVNREEKARPSLPDMLTDAEMDELFEAAADAVEESIYNALCMAETMTGPLGKTVEAIDLSVLKEIVEAHIPKMNLLPPGLR